MVWLMGCTCLLRGHDVPESHQQCRRLACSARGTCGEREALSHLGAWPGSGRKQDLMGGSRDVCRDAGEQVTAGSH